MHKDIDYQQLTKYSQRVLHGNDLGTSTKPAPSLYPHQWNWDSAFIAIGLSHSNQNRAQQEIRSLLKSQWLTGMVPHIVFNPESTNYHPGPEYWGIEIPEAPESIRTSGITQPPVIALAALDIYKRADDKLMGLDFLREVYPALLIEENFLSTSRDPNGEGLSFICHPWESGMDNSAIWDGPLHSFEMEFIPDFMRKDNKKIPANQRPSDSEYTRYSYLVQRYAMESWNQSEIFKLNHFAVQSLLFNTLHLRSMQSLVEIAKIIDTEAEWLESNIEQTMKIFDNKLWDRERSQYFDYDLSSHSSIDSENISQFLPLFAGIPSPAQAEILVAKLQTEGFWPSNGYGICTQSRESSEYDKECYWRGPVWINMNWMIIKGLNLYGYNMLAGRLAHDTLSLVAEHGCYEYFNPETGEGLGRDSFSWTAALVLDLISEGYK